MTIYRDTNAEVTFEHPYPGPLVASVYRDDVLIYTSSAIMPEAGRYNLSLSYVETQYDGPLTIVWASVDNSFVRTVTEEVVTPLVSITKLRTVFTESNWTDASLMEVESSVRTFIQNYTGQEFGYEVGTKYVVGNNEKRIALPRHLIALSSVNSLVPGFFWVSNDGWYLNTENKNYLTIKEAPPEEFMDYTIAMTHGVIVVPDWYWKKFRAGHQYAITGEWGYYSVPDDVQESALLLANDFACGDSLYRDRFVESVKYSDGSLTFSKRAWDGTGNARVDKLLEQYDRRSGMVII